MVSSAVVQQPTKGHGRRIVKYALVGVLVVAIIFVAGLQYDQIYTKACQAAEKDCAAHKMAFGAVAWIGKLLDDHNGAVAALAACFVATFTYTLWRSTDRLWLAGEAQLKHLKNTTEAELRAYLNVTYTKYCTGHSPNRNSATIPLHALVDIKNFGRTPAHDVRIGVVFEYAPQNDDKAEAERRRLSCPPAILAPGDVLHHTLPSTRWPIYGPHREGSETISVYGIVTYRDRFCTDGEPDRRTDFAYTAGRDEEPLIPTADGNDAT